MWLQKDGPVPTRSSPRERRVSPRRPIAIAGAVVPGRYSSMSGAFSRFTYEADDYEAVERQRQGKSAVRMSRSVASESDAAPSPRPLFKHCALPPAPKAAGAFQRFRYSIDPFEIKEDHKREELRQGAGKMLAGAFVAGGNARNEKRSLKRRSPELRAQITHALRADWPSFLRVSADERGTLLAAFAAERLSAERRRDLHDYMNRLMLTHPLAAEFALNRDPTCWGVARTGEQGSTAGVAVVLYALRPPWVPPDLLTAHKLLQKPAQSPLLAIGGGEPTGAAKGGTPA
jgi:hypothetical protein